MPTRTVTALAPRPRLSFRLDPIGCRGAVRRSVGDLPVDPGQSDGGWSVLPWTWFRPARRGFRRGRLAVAGRRGLFGLVTLAELSGGVLGAVAQRAEQFVGVHRRLLDLRSGGLDGLRAARPRLRAGLRDRLARRGLAGVLGRSRCRSWHGSSLKGPPADRSGTDQGASISGVTADSVSGTPSSAARLSAIASSRRIRPATASLVITGSDSAPSSSSDACVCSSRSRP